ncbi:MAG: response regulator [Gammaproteobacteria bacterium]|uniref:response regulator n=1 Tax=Rhodoferax sp. TaxID=50421 RepID=UPI0017BAD419|nr:response regulator [Rhodoferax sp.]MBU3900677.1 response regulator [Gammaproteobacteria bacterium]MBA3058130.1 response regulator [Rhodoferax sp.]MBU3998397.1 response regulator [Gammaproteobacteria bacterium]MBU4081335.1 response regulator [Gammaproteobacteria bacterium]MBU4114523.1 response regulator [Gammaproteobacteria bacterium]
MRVLLVEDDPMIGEAVRVGLARLGITVDWVRDGELGLQCASSEPFDAVVLDLGLPRRDGMQVLRDLRSGGHLMPILVVTARDALSDRVAGLDAGADDYILKPFELDELAARLRSGLRSRSGRADPVLRSGALALHPDSKIVTKAGAAVPLSAREFALLELLMRRPGMPMSRAQLEERLLGWGEEVASNALEVNIHNLRRKLGADSILNIRGVGYFVPRDEATCTR